MAFIAEDGTGLPDANSLCSLEFTNAYFTDRVVTAWTGTDAAKQGALIRATDYVEYRWGAHFAGDRQFTEDPAQALSFPRLYIGYDDTVPEGVQKAVAEYALRALTGELAPDPVTDTTGRAISGLKQKVGPIETETRYQTGVVLAGGFKPYPAADMMLRAFLSLSGGSLLRV